MKITKILILFFATLNLLSYASFHSKSPELRRPLASNISIDGKKCFAGPVHSAVNCAISQNEKNKEQYIIQINFPKDYFVAPPACVTQIFKNERPGINMPTPVATIEHINSSLVRFEFSRLNPELYHGNLAFSYICTD